MATGRNWAEAWLDAVKDGDARMSQRAMTSIAANGGLANVVKAAKARGLHLVKLTDDKGKALVAASPHPFKTLC